MSTTQITVERVNEVEHHPNADRLDIIQVLGYKTIVGREQFQVGESAIFFPPDLLIPEAIAEELGVKQYLKHAIYAGDEKKSQCRVSAARLRGIPSHGFAIGPVENSGGFGANVTARFYGVKYEPPVRIGAGDAEPEWANFHVYTSIENIQREPDRIPEHTIVRITEKIHGTNSRLGLIRNPDGDFEFVGGSHRRRTRQFTDKGDVTLYWSPMSKKMMMLLTVLCDEQNDVIVFGEIFGEGIQDMDYGHSLRGYRILDISVNGKYLNWQDVMQIAEQYEMKLVPLLHVGPFSFETVEKHTYGPTTVCASDKIKSKFKGREGCVVTPMIEGVTRIGARQILKSKSVDYLDRKGAKDLE